MKRHDEERASVTEANRRIAPSEDAAGGDTLPDADDAVTRANQRIARPAEESDGRLQSDAATLRPPD